MQRWLIVDLNTTHYASKKGWYSGMGNILIILTCFQLKYASKNNFQLAQKQLFLFFNNILNCKTISLAVL